MNPELKTLLDEIQGSYKTMYESLDGKTVEQKEHLQRMKTRLDDLEAEMRRPGLPERKEIGGLAGYRTPGQRIIEEKGLIEDFRRTGRIKLNIGNMFPEFDQKTLIDAAAIGYSTPGILNAQRIDAIVPLARRRLTVRDLLRTRPVNGAAVDFIRELAYTNAASPTTDSGTRNESADTFVIASERVKTIGHWIPASRALFDDLPELRRFIDDNLVYGIKLREENEALNGDNLGQHYNGICGQATPYAGSYATAGDTKLDKLRHAILELEARDEACTAFVLNPRDMHDIELIKEEYGGANSGSYVIGDPLQGTLNVRTLWGRPVVSTNSMASGYFLAFDASKVVAAERQDATVDFSESHDEFFIQGKIAVRAELRGCVAVLRTTALSFGAF